jgi:hypothetical protein
MAESPIKDTHERSLPIWLVPTILVVIGAVLYGVLTLKDRGETEPMADLPWTSEASDQLREATSTELAQVMLGDDFKRARTAAIMLTGRGDEGWAAIFDHVAKAEPRVQYEVQTRTQAGFVIEAAARAIAEGTDDARQGAYVAMFEQYPGWMLQRHIDLLFRSALSRAAEADEFDHVYSLVERFHPSQLAPLFESLATAPREVRVKALAAIVAEPSFAQLAGPRENGKDPDPKVVEAAKSAASRIKASLGV